MAAVTYLCRRGARYYYRRRLHMRGLISRPISVALGTADPGEARRLAARLSVIWDRTAMMTMGAVTRGYMTASEAVAVYKRGLDEELGLATAARFDADDVGEERAARVLAAAYSVAAGLGVEAQEVSSDLIRRHTDGFTDADRNAVFLMLKALQPHRQARIDAVAALQAVGAPVNHATTRDAGVQILLARAEAQARAVLLNGGKVVTAGDAVSVLLDDTAVAAMRSPAHASTPVETDTATPVVSAPSIESPYLSHDTRHFSEIIEETIAAIQRSGDWNEDIGQRRMAMRAFAWVTGDKRLCDYRPADAELYAQTLARLPRTFRWGTPEQGAMSRPFSDVLDELQPLEAGEERSPRTINRDLTTMSRVTRELSKVAWKPKLGGAPVMNFNDFSAGVKEDINDPDRMPWTEENLRAAFSSPIYTGGGGCMTRFKPLLLGGATYQDAAYWVPLLLAYTWIAREEGCGLECADFVFDVETPYLVIRANMTRSKDGKTPGGLSVRRVPV